MEHLPSRNQYPGSLEEEEGISLSFPELFFNGDWLKDDQRVVDYGILENATLHMILQNLVRVKLFIKVPSLQKNIVVEARTYDTIQNIKTEMLEKEGILPHQYDLIYAGELLQNDRTVVSLNMQSDPNLHLVFRPKDVLSFSVITPAKEIVKFKVKSLYSVSEVKEIIGGLTGVPVRDYDLIYEGMKLENSNSMACYNIKEESILAMSPLAFQVFVKAWSGKTITLNVCHCDTVQDIKNKIFQKLAEPIYFQSVVFAGKRLETDLDLAHYRIGKDATLHMVFSPSTIVKEMTMSGIGGSALGVPNSTTTIRALKALIQDKIPSAVKEVYFLGKPLHDERSIASYNIGAGDKLTVISELHKYCL